MSVVPDVFSSVQSLIFTPFSGLHQNFTLSFIEDFIVENNETVTMSLSSLDSSVQVLTPDSQLVILDNDSESAWISVWC